MKAKNILMTLLLVTGVIAAKASGYPAELALVSQPVMVYNHNSITVYYDVENIGDYTYRGNVYIYLDPDYGYYYAKEYVKVYPGRIKRIAIDVPAHSISLNHPFTIMPYYEVGRDLYSFTTFEYFEPVRFFWEGPRNEPWVVISIGPRPTYYHRPGTYRFYYDGFRPPMPPHGHGPATPPPPMDPKHHTYGYHHNNGGYPASHPEWNNNPPAPHNNNEAPAAPNATVRPKPNGGSMSSGSYNSGNNGNTPPPAPNSGGISTRPKVNSGTMSGRTPSSGTNSSSGRVGNSSSTSRPSGTSNSSSGRVNGSSSSSSNSSGSRPSSSSSSSSRVNSSSSNSRPASTSSSSSSRSSNSSSSRSSSSSSSSSSSRNGSSSGRR